MIQKLRKLLHLESYEESLRDFSLVLEQSEFLKSEVDLMAREYSNSSKELDQWLSTEKEQEVIELIKSQQNNLTSRYLSFLGDKKSEYDRLEESKKSFIKEYPHFEKALQSLRKSDFIEKTLDLYRENRLSLDECTTIIKALTKEKVKYSDNIVFNQKGEILIVQRGPLDTNGPNLWVLPGGHVNIDEEHEAAAKRELLEETGYNVDDCYQVGEYDDEKCHIEYFITMIDTSEQSPTLDANETRYTEFVPVKDLYKYPTMYNIWDNVYEILGIEENVVKIKKAISEGFVKGEAAEKESNKRIDEAMHHEDKLGAGAEKRKKLKPKEKFHTVMKEWKRGTLHSGGSGDIVTNRKQAIAIAMSESGQSKEKAVESELEKARSGIYENTHENRMLGRVGQYYGESSDKGQKGFLYTKEFFGINFHTNQDRNYNGKKVSLWDAKGSERGMNKSDMEAIAFGSIDFKDLIKLEDSLKSICEKLKKQGITDVEIYKSGVGYQMRPVKSDIEKSQKDTIPGGKADKLTLEDIAKKHKVDIEDLVKEYKIGLKVEQEHTDDTEKAGEITRDHLTEMPDYYTKLKTIEKSDIDEFEKAKKLGHLVPKKVQIKDKSGKVHFATRWVNPQTGESEKYSEGLKDIKRVEHKETLEDTVTSIISSELPKSDKVRNLIDLGIYDTGLLTLLTGEPTPQYFLKQSDIDLKELPDNSEIIKTEIRKEQTDNDTPQEREDNKMLFRKPEDIQELWDNYERNLKRVIQGRHKFAIVYGTGGVGKSFSFEQLAKKSELREYDDEIQPTKDQYDYVTIKGRISPVQVYAEMYRHRDKLIVFDDCDSFLSTEEVQGFLKAGLDTGETTKISNKSSKKVYQVEGDPESGTIPNTFSFKGRVIAITNLVSKQIDQAVKSRALCSNLTMTTDETILKLSTIKDKIKILTADKSSVIEVNQEARDYAFELIKEQKSKLGGDINTRTYANAVLMAHDAMEEGVEKDKIRREIIGYFDSVTGSFDEMIRKQKGK